MDAIRFKLERITLRDRWSGRVLTGFDGEGSPARVPASLPSAGQWQTALAQLMAEPNALPEYEVLKYSKMAEVFRATLRWPEGSIDVVVKRARATGLRRRAMAIAGRNRERTSFDRALMLLRTGVATALPLALLERRGPQPEACLITVFVPDLVDLDLVALTILPQLEDDRRRSAKDAIIKAIVDVFVRLEDHGLFHRDLKASNILLENWDGGKGRVRVYLIDLEGLRPRRLWRVSRRWQPLFRLAASLLGYTSITRGDYARFLRAYLSETGRTSDTWRDHYRELSRRAADYVRCAQRRKTHKLDGYAGER